MVDIQRLTLKLKRFVKRNIKTIIVVAAVVVVSIVTSGAGTALASSIGATGTTASVVAGATTGAIAGATAGGVGTAVNGGNLKDILRNMVKGAVAGGIGGAVGGYFGNTFSLGRVGAQATANGVGSEIMGGHFRDGFKMGAATALLDWASTAARANQIESSKRNPLNAEGESVGYRGDKFKLGGGRVYEGQSIKDASLNPSPLGGVQGDQGKILGVDYAPGSFNDYVVEAYAGTHDFLNSWYHYNANGNAIRYSGLAYGAGEVLNLTNVVVATPIVVGSVLNPYISTINVARETRR